MSIHNASCVIQKIIVAFSGCYAKGKVTYVQEQLKPVLLHSQKNRWNILLLKSKLKTQGSNKIAHS